MITVYALSIKKSNKTLDYPIYTYYYPAQSSEPNEIEKCLY
jgi:hypothetical protein